MASIDFRLRRCVIAVAAAIMAALLGTAPAVAGSFDCSVVYDEFDSLMNKRFLLQPESYVRVATGRISRRQYNGRQKGRLLLKADRQGWGVAVVHTNRNTRGKFLYTWAPGGSGGQPVLMLRDVTLFGRVLDGHAPRIRREIRVNSSFTVDLDRGRVGAGSASDVWFHNIDGNRMYLEAVNGAKLAFPMESLCR